jgi:hypothetical protein
MDKKTSMGIRVIYIVLVKDGRCSTIMAQSRSSSEPCQQEVSTRLGTTGRQGILGRYCAFR